MVKNRTFIFAFREFVKRLTALVMETILERKTALHQFIDQIEDEYQLGQLEQSALEIKSEKSPYSPEILAEVEIRKANFNSATAISWEEMAARLDKIKLELHGQ